MTLAWDPPSAMAPQLYMPDNYEFMILPEPVSVSPEANVYFTPPIEVVLLPNMMHTVTLTAANCDGRNRNSSFINIGKRNSNNG